MNHSSGSDFSDISDDEFIPELGYSDSDESEIDELSRLSHLEENENDPSYLDKNGLEWQPQPFGSRHGKIRKECITTLRPGVTRYAISRVNEIKDAFLLFFPPHIENIILKHSNAYAEHTFGEKFIKIDSDLLHAYFAILILAGVYR